MRALFLSLLLAACAEDSGRRAGDAAGSDAADTNAADTPTSDTASADSDDAGTAHADTTPTDTGADTEVTVSRRCERTLFDLPAESVAWREVDEFAPSGQPLRGLREFEAVGTQGSGAGDRLVRTIHTRGDARPPEDGDDWIKTRTYDAEGRLVAIDIDERGDGTVEWRQTWRYPPSGGGQASPGNWVEFVDHTRYTDERTERDFDPVTGELVALRLDTPWPNAPDLTITYTNVGGRPVGAHRVDTRIDPSVEDVTYRYDDLGRLVENLIDYRGDGSIDRRWTFEYDAHGRLERTGARDGDGTWVEGTIISFDARDRVIRTLWDSTLDGAEQADYRYFSDEEGGGVAEGWFAYPASDPPKQRETWSASCHQRVFWQDYRGDIDL